MTAPKPQAVQFLPIDEIVMQANRRPVDEGAVTRLMESIERIGLLTPISFRLAEMADPETGDGGRCFVLITGRHRHEAFKRLGRKDIPAIQRDCDERDARLEEIAENLHRADLTALQQSEQIAEWKRIWAEKDKDAAADKPAQLGPVKGGRGNKGGDREAARALNKTRQQIDRSDKIANLSDEAKDEAQQSGLDDNQSVLLGAAKASAGLSDAEKVAKEVAHLRGEAARRAASQARKDAEKERREQDRAIEVAAAGEFAVWLMERTDLGELPTIISWLEAAKPKDVIAALRRVSA